MYRIKDVSEKTGLTYHTIRYYTDEGLIPEVIRDKNNNRLFNDRSIRIFNCLKQLRNSGLSIKELKAFIDLGEKGDSTIPERKKLMRERKKIMRQKIIEAEKSIEYLEYKEAIYEQRMRDKGIKDE